MHPAPPGASTCPTCGGVLEKTPSGGLGCMSCLLRAGIGSEEETVHDSTPGASEGGVRFGVYEIDCHADGSLYELGRGAMGVTYRATDTSLQRKVALKIIKIDIAERSADARERFMREARAAAALRHENIATVHQFGMRLETGQYFYAMELIEGETLEERVRRAGPLNARATIQIAQQVISALAAAEKAGLVHRDLKPANLMLVSPDGEPGNNKKLLVKIIDFGLAKAIHTQTDPKSLTHDRFVGTPAFASPEQFEHSALDVRSDIYSLGDTLWFALTGKTPFAGRTVAEIHRAQQSNVLPLEQLKAAHVPSRLRSLLESMLALEPASRPGTHELAARLQRCSPEARHVRRVRLGLAAAALLILGVSASFMFLSLRPRNSLSNLGTPDKSIAVLPFENLSRDPDNAYFADGIQDEILTRLSKISDLKVISRTSTQTYKNAPRNLRDIARQLGVSSILEGRVQKSADQVRVTVQLINAETDSHLWAESYDRKFSDIFQVESDVSQKIATALEAKLTGREKSDIASVGTENSQAYDAYLRARAVYREYTRDSLQRAAQALEEAVRVDPSFAAAWALLARMRAFAYFSQLDQTETSRTAARQAVETAIRLQPDLAEAQMAKGFYEYWVMDDYDAARRTFEQVQSRWPNNADILEPLGLIAFRQGRWKEAREYFDAAIALNPRDQFLRWNAVFARAHVRDFPAALRTIDQALAIWPDDPGLIADKVSIYQALGELDQADALLSRLRPKPGDADKGAVDAICDQAMLRRDPAAAITLLRTLLSPANSLPPYLHARFHILLGQLEQLSGNADEARASFTQAREALEKELKQQPQNGAIAHMLALTLAGLGERETALGWADRAVELLPSSHDARSGPAYEEMRARIQARFGDGDRAIPTLKHLLEIPYAGALTPALLRLHPDFDPLRGDPRFQELCKDKQPLLSAPPQIPEKSIAVLPFENLSDEKANAYFADGIQNEILTRLASVRDLKVISRTSTAKYQSKPDNLRTIAQELGVSTILEGAVQKAGDKVRVNVQLINAQTDSHLWADTYDRKLTDIFAVESEIATGIAKSLQAKLTKREEQALAVKPTNNPEAYDAYLRGLAFEGRDASQAAGFYNQAVQLDPNFALTWARLSRVYALLHFMRLEPTSAVRDESAKRALENAQRLEPDSSEALLALGYYQFWVLRDYSSAKTTFGRVNKMLPSSSEVPMALALIARREGHWNQSITYYEQALALDPRNELLLMRAAASYTELRQFPAALKLYDRALDISPNDPDVLADKASIYQAEGNLQEAGKLLTQINAQTPSDSAVGMKIIQLRLERNYSEAVRFLQARLAQFHYNSEYFKACAQLHLAFMQRLAGDTTGAKTTAEQACKTLEQLYRDQPDADFIAASLSQAYAAMGKKESALREAQRAIMLGTRAKDPVYRPSVDENLARIQTMFGENSRTISILTQLLQTSYMSWLYGTPVTPALLRLDPIWDPLRADPAFQKLCEKTNP